MGLLQAGLSACVMACCYIGVLRADCFAGTSHAVHVPSSSLADIPPVLMYLPLSFGVCRSDHSLFAHQAFGVMQCYP